MIKVKSTSLEGFLIIEPNCHKDDRGFFLETYQEDIYKAEGSGYIGSALIEKLVYL